MAIKLEPFRPETPGLAALLAESLAEGHGMVAKFLQGWTNGQSRFDGPGEFMNLAFMGTELVGVGGRSIDPHHPGGGFGRVRHVFVANKARRLGVGRLLVARTLIDEAGDFNAINTRAPEAAFDFYVALGFRPVSGEKHVTHRYEFANDP